MIMHVYYWFLRYIHILTLTCVTLTLTCVILTLAIYFPYILVSVHQKTISISIHMPDISAEMYFSPFRDL